MRQFIKIIDSEMQNKTSITTTTGAPEKWRVPLYTNNDTKQTISTTPPNPQVNRLPVTSVPRVDQSTTTKYKYQTEKHNTKFHTTSPAHNTRSRTHTTRPVSRTIAHTQLKNITNKTQTGNAERVNEAMAQMENDSQQALAVMDADTGKLLSYRQFMRNPTFRNN